MNEIFDIIIVAGQSNAEGCGIGKVENAYMEDDRIFQMNPDYSICKAHERVNEYGDVLGRFQLSFAREYLNKYLKCDRKLLIIESAVGGTGFIPYENYGTWCRGDTLSVHMFEMVKKALALHEENKIVAFLWHQGEKQVNFNMAVSDHERYMTELFDDVKEQFGAIPMLLGDFVPKFKHGNKSAVAMNISNRNKEIVQKYSGAFVESEGLLANAEIVEREHYKSTDVIHFSRASLYEFGNRYFEKYNELIRKQLSEL